MLVWKHRRVAGKGCGMTRIVRRAVCIGVCAVAPVWGAASLLAWASV